MWKSQPYIGPRPLEQQPKYVQKAEARRLRHAAQATLDEVMGRPRASARSITAIVPWLQRDALVPRRKARSTFQHVKSPAGFYGGSRRWRRRKKDRSEAMPDLQQLFDFKPKLGGKGFKGAQEAVFGPVPFQQQPRKVRKAYSYDYRRKQARWAKKRGDTGWGVDDEKRALKSYRSSGRRRYRLSDYDYSPRRSRRRRSGRNKYWSAAAWGGGRGGKSRRPKLRRRTRRSSASMRRSYFTPRMSPRICRTKKRRFYSALARARAPFSPRKWNRMSAASKRRRTGASLSRVAAYCKSLTRRRRKGGRRSRRR